MTAVCAVILAAGEGQRLRPLTATLPKALCPVGNVPLLDHALTRVAGAGITSVAVNASYLASQIVEHVGTRAHLSIEPDGPLGTSGGVARLREWIDGRGVLVGNADAYLADPSRPPGKDIAALLDGWSGTSVRMLAQPVVNQPGGFSNHRFAGFSLLPWSRVRDLIPSDGGLVRDVWRPAEAAGELELIPFEGTYLDTGTPPLYLAANLHAAAGRNLIAPTARVTGGCTEAVVGAGAVVAGTVTRGVVLPGATVAEGEHLTDAIRAGTSLTVHA